MLKLASLLDSVRPSLRWDHKTVGRFGKRAAKFLNMQFAFIVITFFVLSLNAISAPLASESSLINPLTEYNPDALVAASRDINPYIPVLQNLDQKQVEDQVLSAVVGSETAYVPKPMLVETVDHETASRVLRGLRKETITHTVAQGETLSKIAEHYGLNVATLLEDNQIDVKDLSKIKPGTQLAIAPEKTTDSTDWLTKLHEEEQRIRNERLAAEQARQAKLAKANASRTVVASARAADTSGISNSGQFRKPIGGGCYNGYHWYAIDCPASPGVPIRAAAAGVVISADASGYNGGYGKTILISHGNGWETRYAHMSALNLSVGQRVEAGGTVGLVGNTGRSTGPHLHFEVIKNGQRLNPVNYVGT